MLRAAILFFVIGLVAMLLGATGFAGLSVDIGKTLLIVFLILAVLSFLVSLFQGRSPKVLPAILLAFGVGALAIPQQSYANEPSVTEQAKEAGRDVKKVTKKTVRNVKDKTCEMVNGKMECAVKKVKHKAENAVDEAADAVNEPKTN
ncbi:MAG: DUF1328 domain-containing protein [Bdellovibrionaceae bacterium]|nr:DUF1328 domain-containing protein [Pseudobdellovibrionaceae bacterium]